MSMTQDNLKRPRQRMIDRQLKDRNISDPSVLEAMNSVPRHLFIDEALTIRAYDDCPLPIGYGQTISQPYMVALMTQALNLTSSDRVLEIGSGCGYQTAILARLSAEVFAIERLAALFDKSRVNLERLNITNIHHRMGDGSLGWPEMAPFQAILVAAFCSKVPPALTRQLAPGGRLVIPVGSPDNQRLLLLTKKNDESIIMKSLAGCRFVPLVDN